MLGKSELEELELHHLGSHKKFFSVNIGNGAATHIQLVRASSYRFRDFWFGYNWRGYVNCLSGRSRSIEISPGLSSGIY